MSEDSFENRLNGTSPVKIKKEGPGSWRAFTFIFALLFVASAAGAVYFYNKFYTVEESYNKLAKQTSENANQQAQENKTSGSETGEIEVPENILLGKDFNIRGLYDLLGENAKLDIEKMATTNDGKYLFIMSNVIQGLGGKAGTWYLDLDNPESGWKELQSGHQISYCSSYSEESVKVMAEYGYMDDDMSSKYIGCFEEDGQTERY